MGMELVNIMNWVDIFMIIILIYTVTKGLRLGFLLSIFNMIQVLLSIIITKRYYSFVYEYIINNPKVYNIFKGITEFILKIFFYSKSKGDINLIPNLISRGLLKIVTSIFVVITIFFLANRFINLFLGIFSFLLKAPVLNQLNKIGGMLFGLMEGLLIIYILNLVLSPIASIFPKTFIGKSILDSIIYNYIGDLNLMLKFFSNTNFI